MPTIGIDFRLKTLELDGRTIKVQVWDTAGQERFRTITHNYYRGAHGIALIFDLTNATSFENTRKWIADVHTYAESNVNLILMGNKVDLAEKRVVDESAGRALAEEYNIDYFEASAKNDVNVTDAFNTLVQQVVTRLATTDASTTGKKDKNNGDNVTVSTEGGEKKKCC